MSYNHQVMYRVLAGAAVVVLSSAAQAGAVLYVDDDAPPVGDGTGWGTAYRFLADALADASGGGISEIRVGQGTYKPDQDEAGNVTPGDREATFQLINGVALMGGYAGFGAKDPDARDTALFVTTLTGDLAGDDGPGDFENNAENSYNVTIGSGTDVTAVLDGFTVTAGNANGLDPNNGGAGMLNVTGSPRVTGCDFIDNVAAGPGGSGAGGGMLNETSSSPTISDCTFSGNTSVSDAGGGMANVFGSSPIVTNCTFIGNAASNGDGGGMFNFDNSSPTVTACTFDSNFAQVRGGGMSNDTDSNPTVTNCVFTANTTGSFGGGGMANGFANPTVENCTFTGNSAFFGGGMENFNSSPTIVNCQFIDNIATGNTFGGGGILSTTNSNPTVTNCTFSNNSANNGGAVATSIDSITTITNCILWNDSPNEIGGAVNVVNYSDVEGGFSGTGNIDVDPLLVDPLNGDYRLGPGSPCIDAADNTAVPKGTTTDLDGNPRFVDDPDTPDTGNGVCHVDMGAYEFQGGVVTCCPGDINGDGVVNVLDLIDLLLCFGQPGVPGCEAEDVNGDGVVNVLDLIELLLAFGTTCP